MPTHSQTVGTTGEIPATAAFPHDFPVKNPSGFARSVS